MSVLGSGNIIFARKLFLLVVGETSLSDKHSTSARIIVNGLINKEEKNVTDRSMPKIMLW